MLYRISDCHESNLWHGLVLDTVAAVHPHAYHTSWHTVFSHRLFFCLTQPVDCSQHIVCMPEIGLNLPVAVHIRDFPPSIRINVVPGQMKWNSFEIGFRPTSVTSKIRI